MNITIKEGVDGARNAKGIAVIIDVLRAATVASYLLDKGVTSIHPVATPEEAFDFKMKDEEVLLVGENKGIKIDGFDIGNSPSVIKTLNNLDGKMVVHRSSTGTQGLVNSTNANQIIFGSFVSAQAILDFLKASQSEDITFVPMYALEDQLFAEYMVSKLKGETHPSLEEVKAKLEQHEWILNSFLNPQNDNFPEDDFHLALEVDTFNFFPIIKDGKIVKSN